MTAGRVGGDCAALFPEDVSASTPQEGREMEMGNTGAPAPIATLRQAIGQWPQLARSATVTGSLWKLVREQRVEHSPGGGCRLAGDGCHTGHAVVTGWHRQAALPKERYRSNPKALVVAVTGNARRTRLRCGSGLPVPTIPESWRGTANGNHPVPVLVSPPRGHPYRYRLAGEGEEAATPLLDGKYRQDPFR